MLFFIFIVLCCVKFWNNFTKVNPTSDGGPPKFDNSGNKTGIK